ncbi:unnamed protein product, partial [Didymodactylos carnosus]
TFEFLKDNQPLITTDNRITTNVDDNTNTYKIVVKDLKPTDEGI